MRIVKTSSYFDAQNIDVTPIRWSKSLLKVIPCYFLAEKYLSMIEIAMNNDLGLETLITLNTQIIQSIIFALFSLVISCPSKKFYFFTIPFYLNSLSPVSSLLIHVHTGMITFLSILLVNDLSSSFVTVTFLVDFKMLFELFDPSFFSILPRLPIQINLLCGLVKWLSFDEKSSFISILLVSHLAKGLLFLAFMATAEGNCIYLLLLGRFLKALEEAELLSMFRNL